jgi:hypothetical protein
MGGGFPFKSTDNSFGVFMDYASAGFNSFANNIWLTITGKEKFGQHKNWGGGKSSWLSETMRGMMEGGNYKEWDAYNAGVAERKRQGAARVAEYNAAPAYEPAKETTVYNWSTQPDGTIKQDGVSVGGTKSKPVSYLDAPKPTETPSKKKPLQYNTQSKSLLTDDEEYSSQLVN